MPASRLLHILALVAAVVAVLAVWGSLNEAEVTRAIVDTDGDGYDDAKEAVIGTNPLAVCSIASGTDAWPPDFNQDQNINILDWMATFPQLGGVNPRFDLNVDGRVSIPDLAHLLPPMMPGSCASPYVPPAPAGTVGEIAIDMDTTGNDARLTLGANVQECGEIDSLGANTIDFDVVLPAPGVNAADGIEAFEFILNYNPAVVSVTAKNGNFLLTQATGSGVSTPGAESLPDADGSFRSGALDTAASPLPEPAGPHEVQRGVLTRITLTGVTPGTSSLTLTGVVLMAGSNAEIPVSAVTNATVSVDEACVPVTATDTDGDGVPDISDNCPTTPNGPLAGPNNQLDADFDGVGDVCDTEGPHGNSNGLLGADDCTDGVDNDGDGLTDGAEPGCQLAIFSVRPLDIVGPPAAIPCEASALLTLPTLTGSGCSRPPLAPDLYLTPAFLGLDLSGPFADNLDAVSLTELSNLPSPAFHFSVESGSTGLPCAAPEVFSEAGSGEAHGDIFTDLNVSGCNALFQDEAVQGLNAPGLPVDDMDALTETPSSPVLGACIHPVSAAPIPCPVFSVDATSTVLGVIGASPADLLEPPSTPGCAGPTTPCVAVPAPALGLDGAGYATDDLDALCWFDLNLNGLPDLPLAVSGPDQYYFSLAPGSATLTAMGFGEGDILVPTPAGVIQAVFAGRLGLAPGDNLDGLKCLDPDSDGDGWRDIEQDNCPYAATVWWVPSGDEDCDGFSTGAENGIGTDPGVDCDDGIGLPDWPPDTTDDQNVNILDVFPMFPFWVAAGPARLDLNIDGVINILDVFPLFPMWVQSCT